VFLPIDSSGMTGGLSPIELINKGQDEYPPLLPTR
jgi:hypothetical protein